MKDVKDVILTEFEEESGEWEVIETAGSLDLIAAGLAQRDDSNEPAQFAEDSDPDDAVSQLMQHVSDWLATLISDTRSRIASTVKGGVRRPDVLSDILQIARQHFERVQQGLTDSLEVAALRGAQEIASDVVVALPDIAAAVPDIANREIQFPVLDTMIKNLQDANLFSDADYRIVSEAAQSGSFAVTGDLRQATLEELRDRFARNLLEDPSEDDFIEELTSVSGLSENHLRTVFRGNMGAGMREGRNQALANPLVGGAVPYRAYNATSDRAVRSEHWQLESRGLNGTNIYNALDPVWKMFDPPWDWGCRCKGSPVTVAQAARRGVIEARQWMDRAKEMAAKHGGSAAMYLDETRPLQFAFVAAPNFRPPAEFQRSSQFAEGEYPRWVTIGGHEDGDKQHADGFPVQIDKDGTILKGGPAGIQGTDVSKLKETFDNAKRKPEEAKEAKEEESEPEKPKEEEWKNPFAVEKKGRRYYVKGDTYEYRSKFKAAGLRWDPEEKAWWSGRQADAETAAEQAGSMATGRFTINPDRKYNNVIKAAGGWWNPNLRTWTMPSQRSLDAVQQKLDKDQQAQQNRPAASTKPAPKLKPSPPPKPKKAPTLPELLESSGRKLRGDGQPQNFQRSLGHGKRNEIQTRAPQPGDIIRRNNEPWMITAVETPMFVSSDIIEDNDAWSSYRDGAGWYTIYDAVPVEPNDAERQEQESAAKRKADIEARQSITSKVRNADNHQFRYDVSGMTKVWGDNRESMYIKDDTLVYTTSSYDDGPHFWVVQDKDLAERAKSVSTVQFADEFDWLQFSRPRRPKPVQLSEWAEYVGPRGGQGWKHTQTGDVRYQAEMPKESGGLGFVRESQESSDDSGLGLLDGPGLEQSERADKRKEIKISDDQPTEEWKPVEQRRRLFEESFDSEEEFESEMRRINGAWTDYIQDHDFSADVNGKLVAFKINPKSRAISYRIEGGNKWTKSGWKYLDDPASSDSFAYGAMHEFTRGGLPSEDELQHATADALYSVAEEVAMTDLWDDDKMELTLFVEKKEG